MAMAMAPPFPSAAGSAGLLVAAPASGSGKTLFTLGLLAALRRNGVAVRSAKAGPDYIDPAFHAAATGGSCVNLDPWAMRPALLRALAARTDAEMLVVEGMMGLFDGAADGSGSTADLGVVLGLPVLLVIDCARQSHSVAALARGFATHRSDVRLDALLLNRVGSARHERMLRAALAPLGVPVAGVLPFRDDLALPSRHLGLVGAGEHPDLRAFFARAADWVESGVDLAAIAGLRGPAPDAAAARRLPPLGARIAVARDDAFAFLYPHLLAGWCAAGAAVSFFSPLADQAPDEAADAVFLPGGYPELHAGRIAAADRFRAGMLAARARGALIYGECGGYMVLGEALEDANGARHAMLGLLPLDTSFRTPERRLGYRQATPLGDLPWAMPLRAHEFRYAAILREGAGERLFAARDALGEAAGTHGLRRNRVMGSFLHVIDRADR